LLAVLAVAGCAHRDGDEARSDDRPARAPVVDGSVDAPYVAGDRLYGFSARPRQLGGAIATTLTANLAPAAVPDAAGRRIAYNSWRGRRPVIRLHELGTREDVVLAEGAYSPALRADGALAYFAALRPELPRLQAIRRYVGHVVVRTSLHSEARRWTSAQGRYVVAAWAGRRLLAYRITRRWPDLLVLDGPARVRVLAGGSALVAVSPDGRRAFVTTYGASPPVVRVLDVATGEELASLVVRRLEWLTESGSWEGDIVVATGSAGVAVFRVGDAAVTLEQILRTERGVFPAALFEPRLADRGRRIVAWGELSQQPRQTFAGVAVVECDRVELRCIRSRPLAGGVGVRLVYDPSRP
jgi:hypothetical protein